MKGNRVCIAGGRPLPVTLLAPFPRVHDHLAAVARVVRVGFRSLRVLKVMALLCAVHVLVGNV
jgi:hypothetical protein